MAVLHPDATPINGPVGTPLWRTQLIADLAARNPGPTFLYYFDIRMAETLRRHQSKPIANDVASSSLRDWYGAASPLGHPGEMIISENLTVEQAARFIGRTSGLAS
jgi:hypothetical protein